MNYLSDEDQKNLFRQQMKYYLKAIKGIDSVKEVIKQFDGKVINKRLYDKLPDNYSIGRDGVEFYSQLDRCIKSTHKDSHGYSCTNYIMYDTVHFGNYTGFEGGREIIFKDDDNRLNAEHLIKLIDLNIDRLNKQLENMDSALKQVDAYKQEQKALRALITAYNDKIDYLARQYFNLTIEERR